VRVRFWGTRGSLPVSLTWRDMRDRLVRALVLAAPHNLDSAAKAQAVPDRMNDSTIAGPEC